MSEPLSLAPAQSPAAELDSATVAVANLLVSFGQVRAVDGISFSVGRGEVFGLLGPNGAGKTTTLRVLTTLLRPDAGSATVAGHDVSRESLLVRASIGYVPQALSADGALTARENLEFYARVTGVPRQQRSARIEEVSAAMEIEGLGDRLARNFSGGMLRRLEIASALLNEPIVLFLDEPTVGLDPIARGLVWDRLHALRRRAGTTIVVTTHMMEEAERNCARLAIMDRGRVVEEGAPRELLERHRVGSLEDVFRAVTGLEVPDEGRMADVRSTRRVARRLG